MHRELKDGAGAQPGQPWHTLLPWPGASSFPGPLRGRFCPTLVGKRRQECGGGSSELALRGTPRFPPTPTAQGGPSVLASGRLRGEEQGRLRTQWVPGPGLRRVSALSTRPLTTHRGSLAPPSPAGSGFKEAMKANVCCSEHTVRAQQKVAFLPSGLAACGQGFGLSQMCRDVRHSMMGLGGSCPRTGPRFPLCEQTRRRVLQRVTVSVNREGVCQVCSRQTRHQSELLPPGPGSPQALVKSGWDAGMTGLTHGHGLALSCTGNHLSLPASPAAAGLPSQFTGKPSPLAHGWG